MSELRELFEGLGHTQVRTLLNSGNVVFRAAGSQVRKLAPSIEARIEAKFEISARVTVVTAAEVTAILRENPLRAVARDPSKHLVAFVASPAALAKAKPLLEESWAPEAFAIGSRAAYLWCPNGVVDAKLPKALARLLGEAVTTRNWATVQKLEAAAKRLPNAVDR